MSEDEWNAATDPTPMVAYLRSSGKANDRKLRLFAVASCRSVWHLLADERSRRAVEAAERLADGRVTEEKVNEVADAAYAAADDSGLHAYDSPQDTAWEASHDAVWRAAHAIDPDAFVYADAHILHEPNRRPAEYKMHVAVLRDLFGPLPFRQVHINPAWLAWNGATAVRLARSVYGDHRFENMLVLGDALEEAGCRDQDILGHCRQEGLIHVRGCWLVDLILGKS